MMRFRNLYIILFVFGLFKFSFAQEEYIVNQTKYMQKANPSYFGMNQLNRVGVLYGSLKVNDANTLDNRYFFGSMAFQDNNFSIGIDINQFKMGNIGMVNSVANLSYIYKLQLSNYTFFLPSVTIGMISSNVDVNNLLFEDQITSSLGSGFIATQSADPLAPLISSVSEFDLGASFLIHSEEFLVGLTLKHLRKPNISFNKEADITLPIQIGIQGGYEFDINPYERRFLPRYSYLFTYANIVKSGEAIYIGLAQDFQLGEFSIGLTQQAGSVNSFGLNNFGMTLGLAFENFDFGVHYNFPFREPGKVYSPSIFEFSVIFDFSIYRRNNRGLYKRLQIDNYY